MDKLHVCWDNNQVGIALEALNEYLGTGHRFKDGQDEVVRRMILELENEAEQNQLNFKRNF